MQFAQFHSDEECTGVFTNQALLDQVHRLRTSKTLILDLDCTLSDTYGSQESCVYNAHYGNSLTYDTVLPA
ncbi:transposase [Sporolactobacillus nakayamae]|uniref:transposase n=1 Tax=Sporolactobacillus nakayamae TaxID=269670 RepID=UPI0011603283